MAFGLQKAVAGYGLPQKFVALDAAVRWVGGALTPESQRTKRCTGAHPHAALRAATETCNRRETMYNTSTILYARQCRTLSQAADSSSGIWICTEDCGGGNHCSAPCECPGPNPAEVCRTSADQCLPSSCSCNFGGRACTEDCGGGKECGAPTKCEGENPSWACRTSTEDCIPSACGCNGSDGWFCTADCGGGKNCEN